MEYSVIIIRTYVGFILLLCCNVFSNVPDVNIYDVCVYVYYY